MSIDSREFVVRRPRHEAMASASCHVWLELISREPCAQRNAELVDLSRQGLQLKLDAPLNPEECVVVRIQHTAQRLDLKFTGHTRWQHACEDGSWAIGCVFDEPIGYEALGELFLSGILSMDTDSSSCYEAEPLAEKTPDPVDLPCGNGGAFGARPSLPSGGFRGG